MLVPSMPREYAMTDESVLRALRPVTLFEDLSDRELKAVADAGRVVSHDTGQAITSEGESGVGFHLIIEGSAEVTVGGDRRARLGPGDHFGEISLIDGGPRTATVTVLEPTRTFSLSAWTFGPLLDKHPQITRKVLLGLCKVVRSNYTAATGD